MSELTWHWHRLRAMSPLEVALHLRRKWRQRTDTRRSFADDGKQLSFGPATEFPALPPAATAPSALRDALRKDAAEILAGHWHAFGDLTLKVDNPPCWQCDYVSGRDLTTRESAFRLNHRALPGGADIRVVWELNRWQHLTRLAMASYVLDEDQPGSTCLAWLKDWVEQNPAYRGWNWTSALEAGLRLIQFTWIDALLTKGRYAPQREADLAFLRARILPAHVWYVWRYRSFGSSANNHLLGELAGLIVALARWPALAEWVNRRGVSLRELQWQWERQVLKQFAEDGGNREQALGYQLFAWELCWHARRALLAHAAHEFAPGVEDRLNSALRFFWEMQSRSEHWDYGDSDNATALPVGLGGATRVREWRSWAAGDPETALEYWISLSPLAKKRLGSGMPAHARPVAGWWIYEQSGMALNESGFWWLRWDLSPLGYQRTAAHGHLDVLHVSIWYRGAAMVVDPGTGAYFADPPLRTWLASREAHNGPCPIPNREPRRLGPFLWSRPHGLAHYQGNTDGSLQANALGYSRRITYLLKQDGWEIEDRPAERWARRLTFVVRWQFAPGTWVKRISAHKFSVHRADVSVMIEADTSWDSIELLELSEPQEATGEAGPGSRSYEGVVSPAFRQVLRAPCLKLTAVPKQGQPCVFRTRFLASPAA